MSALVLDAEALSSLAQRRPEAAARKVTAALKAAYEAGVPVQVPAAVLAELYRGPRHDSAVDACLGREGGIDVVDTTRGLARKVGALLAGAGRGSEHHVDATVIAVAVAAGGGVILTSDFDDLSALSAGLNGIVVEPVAINQSPPS